MAVVLTQHVPKGTEQNALSEPPIITAEEFAVLVGASDQSELVRGKVVEIMPPGGIHGLLAALIVSLLRAWVVQNRSGIVGVESGFMLSRNPDTVRAPDVSFIHSERIPAEGVPTGYWRQAPDLAVEIISPSESAEEVHAKVRDYLAAGSALVWTVYPGAREVVVHTPDGVARTHGGDAVLEFPDALPGFRCSVAEIFAPLIDATQPAPATTGS